MISRIAVLGAGGIGGSIAAYLAEAGRDVTVIDQWGAHIDAIKAKGLTVSDVNHEFTVRVPALHLSEVSTIAQPFDAVFLSVKSYDTVWSTHLIAPYLAPSGVIAPAMNCLNDETVARIVGYSRVVGCVTTISAGVYTPGHVVRTDPTTLHAFSVGELSGIITPRVNQIVEMLGVIGESEATPNIWGARWAKLVWNSMGNAMAGLIASNSEGLSEEELVEMLTQRARIGCEATQVAAAKGIVLGPVGGIPPEVFDTACQSGDMTPIVEGLRAGLGKRALTPEQQARLPEPNRPSLFQDVLKRRRTEVDYLNGEIVRQGAMVGIATPANQRMVEVMHRLEAGEIGPGVENLALLR